MYPIRLNLLSPQKKNHLKRMALFIFFKNILETSLIIVLISAVALVGGRWFLQNYFNDLTEKMVAVSNQKSDVNQRIKHANTVLRDISLMQREYTPWTPTIQQVAEATPEQVMMQSIVLEQETHTLTFAGTAKTRTDLLEFQKNLQALPFIGKVELPLSQLTEKEQIPFIIKASIKEETP